MLFGVVGSILREIIISGVSFDKKTKITFFPRATLNVISQQNFLHQSPSFTVTSLLFFGGGWGVESMSLAQHY